MKRILSGLLAAVMLLGAAAGCSETKTEEETEKNAAVMPETPVPEEAPETDPPEYEAPGKDCGGATFTTAAIDYYSQGGGTWACQSYCKAYTDETTGEILNDAIYERNEKVSETLNVKMATFSLTSYGSAGTEIRDALLGGETSVAILPEEMHGICMKYNPTKENYYYADLPSSDYRFVFLNSCDRPYRIGENGHFIQDYPLEISNAQAEWIEKDALVTDRKILVFSHAPVCNAGIFGSVGKGGGYVRSHDDTLNSSRVYTALKECRNVKAQICGHVHYDNLIYRNRMVIVTSLCSFPQEWAASCPKREHGTITETAFDVFSIKDDLMVITRFGAGCDRAAMLLR